MRICSPGDYIVHASHGIGVFEGIHKIDMQGVVKDYIKLQYAEGRHPLRPGHPAGLGLQIYRPQGRRAGQAEPAGRARSGRRPRPACARPSRTWPRSSSSSTPSACRPRATRSTPDTEWQHDFESPFRIRRDGGPAPLHRGNQGRIWNARPRWIGCSAGTWASARRRWPCAPRSNACHGLQAVRAAGAHHHPGLAALPDHRRAGWRASR